MAHQLVWALNDRENLGDTAHRDFCDVLENKLADHLASGGEFAEALTVRVRPTRRDEIEGLRTNGWGTDIETDLELAADSLSSGAERDGMPLAMWLHTCLRTAWEAATLSLEDPTRAEVLALLERKR